MTRQNLALSFGFSHLNQNNGDLTGRKNSQNKSASTRSKTMFRAGVLNRNLAGGKPSHIALLRLVLARKNLAPKIIRFFEQKKVTKLIDCIHGEGKAVFHSRNL
jgi:hypothetical protein